MEVVCKEIRKKININMGTVISLSIYHLRMFLVQDIKTVGPFTSAHY